MSNDDDVFERDCDVVVVGAGLAGLVAGWRLLQSGADVVVLEARDRVGGRTYNASIGEGQVVEMGGQFIGPGQASILALLSELDITCSIWCTPAVAWSR